MVKHPPKLPLFRVICGEYSLIIQKGSFRGCMNDRCSRLKYPALNNWTGLKTKARVLLELALKSPSLSLHDTRIERNKKEISLYDEQMLGLPKSLVTLGITRRG